METQSPLKKSLLSKTFSNFKFNGKKISFYQNVKHRKKVEIGSGLFHKDVSQEIKMDPITTQEYSNEKYSRNKICVPIRNTSLYDSDFKNKTEYNFLVTQNNPQNDKNNQHLLKEIKNLNHSINLKINELSKIQKALSKAEMEVKYLKNNIGLLLDILNPDQIQKFEEKFMKLHDFSERKFLHDFYIYIHNIQNDNKQNSKTNSLVELRLNHESKDQIIISKYKMINQRIKLKEKISSITNKNDLNINSENQIKKKISKINLIDFTNLYSPGKNSINHFGKLINKIIKYKSFPDLLYSILIELKDIIKYDKCSFYIIDKSLKELFKESILKFDIHKLYQNRALFTDLISHSLDFKNQKEIKGNIFEGNVGKKHYIGYSEKKNTNCEVNFQNLYELNSGIRNAYFLGGICVSKKRNHFLLGMQLSRNKKYSNHEFNHFTEKDERIIRALITFLTLKMKNLKLYYNKKTQLRKLNLLLNLISDLLIERRYYQIFNIIKEKLKYITEYSDCSIMFYEKSSQEMFFCGDYLDTGDIVTLKFPKKIGITSYVLNSKRPYINKTGIMEKNFEKEVDNIISVPNIFNYCFIPLLDFNNNSLGVLQMYNKVSKIKKNEESRLIPLSRMIGMCILNAYEMNASLNLTCSIQSEVHLINDSFNKNISNNF